MSSVEPDMEDLFQEKKRVRNPLVPLGLCLLHFLFLLISFHEISFGLSDVYRLLFTKLVILVSGFLSTRSLNTVTCSV